MLPPHLHGLQPLSFGLFHQQEVVREVVVNLFNELRAHPVSRVGFSPGSESSLTFTTASLAVVDRRAVPAGAQPLPTIRLRQAGARARAAHERYQCFIDTPVRVHDADALKSQRVQSRGRLGLRACEAIVGSQTQLYLSWCSRGAIWLDIRD